MVCTTVTVAAIVPMVVLGSFQWMANNQPITVCYGNTAIVGLPLQESISLTASANAIVDLVFNWTENGVSKSAGVLNHNLTAGTLNYIFTLLGNYTAGVTYILNTVGIANIRAK